jgi:asparagine synthase (glutamine-hydrolysing)
MSYGDGRYWITYNGEIYNFLELRDRLEGLGHRFRSQSDTEVILAAYSQWGEACQLEFNGEWAFAIWDRKDRRLFLSRDRFGVKPLHYYCDGKVFAFASEMKAFLGLSWFEVSYDPSAVAYALTYVNDLEATERCLLQGLRRLRGGYRLSVDAGGRLDSRRWWCTANHIPDVPGDYGRQVEEYRRLFLDSCAIRMRSDVPLGTCLSGGLDSSSVLCAMARVRRDQGQGRRVASDWQRAFIAAFPGSDKDETPYAEQVVRFTGTRPLYREIRSEDALGVLDEVLFQFEEIYHIPVAQWLIYRELRREGVVISMDGHGGDEALAGYRAHLEAWLRKAFWGMQRGAYGTAQEALRGVSFSEDVPSWKEVIRRSVPEMVKERSLTHSVCRGIRWGVKGLPWLRTPPWPPHHPDLGRDLVKDGRFSALARILYYDFHYATLPTLLRNYDRCSMAHGVEIRTPFLDWRLVCYAFGLPDGSKVGEGFTKRVLRDAMGKYLPEGIRNRKVKMGFRSPLIKWLGEEGMKSFVLDCVRSRSFLESPIWRGPRIRDHVERAYREGTHGEVAKVWSYIQAMRIMNRFQEAQAI